MMKVSWLHTIQFGQYQLTIGVIEVIIFPIEFRNKTSIEEVYHRKC